MNTLRVVRVPVLTFFLWLIAIFDVSAAGSDTIWSRRYRGDTSSSDDRLSGFCTPRALHVDNHGFIILGGTARGGGSWKNGDIAVLKYDSAGETVWARHWDGSGGREDLMNRLLVDESGNIYVTGSTMVDGIQTDCVTLKYDSDGVLSWGQRHDGLAHGSDKGEGIALGALNEVIVIGSTDRNKGADSDWLILKYDSLGTLMWQQNYGGILDDMADHISIITGGLYVGGAVYDEVTQFDWSVGKFDSQGELRWMKGFSSPGALWDNLTDMHPTSDNRIILVGKTCPSGNWTDSDITVAALDSSGAFLWVRDYGGERKLDDIPVASLVDHEGSIYVTGLTESHDDRFDVVTMKLARDGQLIWRQVFAGAAGGFDSPCDMKLDSMANVHVLAQSSSSVALLTYSSDGELLAEILHDVEGEISTPDGPVALALGPHGYRYVLVRNRGDFVVVKFRPL